MEHEVLAETDGVVRSVEVAVGDSVDEGQLLLLLEPASAVTPDAEGSAPPEGSSERTDLLAVHERHAALCATVPFWARHLLISGLFSRERAGCDHRLHHLPMCKSHLVQGETRISIWKKRSPSPRRTD